jgi:hypothetical protein
LVFMDKSRSGPMPISARFVHTNIIELQKWSG